MTGRTLDRGADLPLWQQLQRDLVTRLEAGEFAEQFPGELALVRDYAVSRHTVRQALARLRADGLIVAGRGRQPKVAGPPEIHQPLGALYSLFASVEAAGLTQHSVVRTLDVRADAVVADRLGLEGSSPMVYLERVRHAGDEPLAVDRVWLPAAVARPVLAADFSHTGLYRELEERAGLVVSRGREEIRAVVPTAGERRLLGCPRDAAALSITRIGYTADGPVEWRHTIVRGDRFALTAEYSTSGYHFTPPSR